MFDIQKLYWKDQLEYLHCGVILYLSYLLAVIFCVSKPGTNGHFWPWWFVSTRGKERELFFSFFFFLARGGGSWQSWKGRVGTSGWQPVAIFMMLSMRMLSRTKSQEACTLGHTRADTHSHMKRKTFSHARQKPEHCKPGIWTIFVN